jgi:hypothetical protein
VYNKKIATATKHILDHHARSDQVNSAQGGIDVVKMLCSHMHIAKSYPTSPLTLHGMARAPRSPAPVSLWNLPFRTALR